MPANLESFLDTLRRTHSTISVAIISPMDYSDFRDLAGQNDHVHASELPDNSIAVAVFGDTEQITKPFYMCGIAPKHWIELREFDELFEEATYVCNMSGRYVRVQTGMLDDSFGYIAVQSSCLSDMDIVMEDFQIQSTGNFDARYEKLASMTLAK